MCHVIGSSQCFVLLGLNVNVTVQRHQTCIAASLHDFCVRDHIADAVYPKVISKISSIIFILKE